MPVGAKLNQNNGFPYVEDLFTVELVTSKVLMPDGAGGVVWGSGLENEPAEENLPALDTSGNYQLASNTGIGNSPVADSYVCVFINGSFVKLGDGVRTKACYFSADGGITARDLSSIVAGDKLYWNGEIAEYDLATDDSIEIYYFIA